MYQQCGSEDRHTKKARVHSGKEGEEKGLQWKDAVSAIESGLVVLQGHVQGGTSQMNIQDNEKGALEEKLDNFVSSLATMQQELRKKDT